MRVKGSQLQLLFFPFWMVTLFSLGCGSAGELGAGRVDEVSRSEVTPIDFPAEAPRDATGDLNITAIALGTDHCLALLGGRPFRWGLLGAGAGRFGRYSTTGVGGPIISPEVVPNPSPFREWAFGPHNADDGAGHNGEAMRDGVLTADGVVCSVACGGSNSFLTTTHGDVFLYGDLQPPGTPPDRIICLWKAGPRGCIARGAPGPRPRVVKVAAGWRHCLLLTDTGHVYALGDDEYGQCAGVGSGDVRILLPSNETIIGVAAGTCHSLAWNQVGLAFAWGHGGAGRLGLGSAQHARMATRLDTLPERVSAASCGANFTIFVTGGGRSLWACGGNQHGQLGLGLAGNVQQRTPAKLDLPRPSEVVTQLACGTNHTLCLTQALTPDGGVAELRPVVWAWGCAASGQCGRAPGELPREPPVSRPAPEPLVEFMAPSQNWPLMVAAGRSRSLVLAATRPAQDERFATPPPSNNNIRAEELPRATRPMKSMDEQDPEVVAQPYLGSPSPVPLPASNTVTQGVEGLDAAWVRLRAAMGSPPAMALKALSPDVEEVQVRQRQRQQHRQIHQPTTESSSPSWSLPWREQVAGASMSLSAPATPPPAATRAQSSPAPAHVPAFPTSYHPGGSSSNTRVSEGRADDIIDAFCASLLELRERRSSGIPRVQSASIIERGPAASRVVQYTNSPRDAACSSRSPAFTGSCLQGGGGIAPSAVETATTTPRSTSPVAALVELGEEALRTPGPKRRLESAKRAPAWPVGGWSSGRSVRARPCGGSSGAPPAYPPRRQSIAQAPGLPAWLGTMRAPRQQQYRQDGGGKGGKNRRQWWTGAPAAAPADMDLPWAAGQPGHPSTSSRARPDATAAVAAIPQSRVRRAWSYSGPPGPGSGDLPGGQRISWVPVAVGPYPDGAEGDMPNDEEGDDLMAQDGWYPEGHDSQAAWFGQPSVSYDFIDQHEPPALVTEMGGRSPLAMRMDASILRDLALAQVERQVPTTDQWSGVWGSISDLSYMLGKLDQKSGTMITATGRQASSAGIRRIAPDASAAVGPQTQTAITRRAEGGGGSGQPQRQQQAQHRTQSLPHPRRTADEYRQQLREEPYEVRERQAMMVKRALSKWQGQNLGADLRFARGPAWVSGNYDRNDMCLATRSAGGHGRSSQRPKSSAAAQPGQASPARSDSLASARSSFDYDKEQQHQQQPQQHLRQQQALEEQRQEQQALGPCQAIVRQDAACIPASGPPTRRSSTVHSFVDAQSMAGEPTGGCPAVLGSPVYTLGEAETPMRRTSSFEAPALGSRGAWHGGAACSATSNVNSQSLGHKLRAKSHQHAPAPAAPAVVHQSVTAQHQTGGWLPSREVDTHHPAPAHARTNSDVSDSGAKQDAVPSKRLSSKSLSHVDSLHSSIVPAEEPRTTPANAQTGLWVQRQTSISASEVSAASVAQAMRPSPHNITAGGTSTMQRIGRIASSAASSSAVKSASATGSSSDSGADSLSQPPPPRRSPAGSFPRETAVEPMVLSAGSSSSRSSSARPTDRRQSSHEPVAAGRQSTAVVEDLREESIGSSSADSLAEPPRPQDSKQRFTAEIVAGRPIDILKKNGDMSRCFCTMTPGLDILRIKFSKEDREFTDIPLAHVVEEVAGRDTAGTEFCASLETPLDETCVTWALRDSNCITFKLPDVKAAELFMDRMSFFIKAAVIQGAGSSSEAEGS